MWVYVVVSEFSSLGWLILELEVGVVVVISLMVIASTAVSGSTVCARTCWPMLLYVGLVKLWCMNSR